MAIYLVTTKTNPETTQLIEAATKASAINAVSADLVTAKALTASEAISAMQKNVPFKTVAPTKVAAE